MKFSIKDFFSKCDQIRRSNGKLHFLCSDKFNKFVFSYKWFQLKDKPSRNFVAKKSFKDFEDITIQNSLGNNEKRAHLFFFFKKNTL